MSHKIALLSDIHLGVKSSSEDFLSIIVDFFKTTLKNALEVNNVSDVRILGDLFHNRNSINVNVLNVAQDIFEWYEHEMPDVHFKILLGNHDIYYRNRTDVNSVRTLSRHSNVTVINEITEEEIDGKKIITYPWIVSGSANESHFDSHCKGKHKWDLCLGHFEIKGFRQNSNHVCEVGFQPGKFKNFKRVYTGHFHIRSTMKQISYLGSPYEMDWNDYGDTKGIHIYDLGKEKEHFIENHDSPKHVRIRISDILNADDDFIEHLKRHSIKVVIDKKYEEEERLKAFTRIENANPLKIETENDYIEDDIDAEDVDITKLSKPMEFLTDFINSVELSEDLEKNNLLSRLKDMHEQVVSENDE